MSHTYSKLPGPLPIILLLHTLEFISPQTLAQMVNEAFHTSYYDRVIKNYKDPQHSFELIFSAQHEKAK